MERNNSPKMSAGSSSNLQHVCTVCQRLLTSPYKLREHMMIHTGEKPHGCQVCQQAFRTKPDLARHMRIHTGERPYSCKLCDQRFHRSDNLRGHMKVHKDAEGQPYTSNIVRHRAANGQTSVPVLKENGNTKSQQPRTTRKRKQVPVRSQKDNEEESSEPVDVQIEPAEKKMNHQFMCVDCDISFFQRGALAMHMKLVHGRGSSRSASPVTSVSSTSSSPAPHRETNCAVDASSTVYLCRFCGLSFEDLPTLEKHTAVKHEQDPEVDVNKNHTGVDENMNRNTQDEWSIEIDSDAELEKEDNEIIVNRTSGESNGQDLMNDEDTSSDLYSDGLGEAGRSFSCGECDQTFSRNHVLKRHVETVHTEQVPYRCSVCGKGFLRQDRLVAHIRVHTGKSPHTCEHCQKSFTASSSLKEHMKIHTGVKPHHCYLCGKDFRQKCVLTRHVKNVHKVELDQAIHPLGGEAAAGEANIHVSSPVDSKFDSDEPMDFSANRASLSIKSEPVKVDEEHQEEVKQEDEMEDPVYQTTEPVLLEQLNSSVKYHEPPVSDNRKKHSCAACSTKFSSIEALSVHLTSHHVGRFQGNPVQQSSVYPVTPQSNIPNVIIKQEGTAIGELLIKEEVSTTPKAQHNGAFSPYIKGFIQRSPHYNSGLNGHGSSDYDSESSGKSSVWNSPVNGKVHVPFKRSLQCSLCALTFNTQQELNNHTDSHIRSNPFFCGLCSDTFRNTTELEDHVNTHADLIENIKDLKDGELDSSYESNIVCNICREQLEEESELAEHIKMHCPGQGTAAYSCTLCDQSCSKPEEMNTHFGEAHCPNLISDSDLPLFGCNFCYKPFRKVRTLVLHLKSHLLDKPHVCEMCGKTFSLQAYLKQHVRTHTGERPYCCTVCNRRFSQKTQLTLHERQHRGETPFSCETCGKAFTNKSVLKLHRTTHLALPPYKCKVCSRRFSQAGNVRRHIGMVHKDVDIRDGPMYTCDLDVDGAVEENTEPEDQENKADEESQGVFPLDMTKSTDGLGSFKNGAPENRKANQDEGPKEAAEADNDDLVVMGAYYQQQKEESDGPTDFSLTKLCNTKDDEAVQLVTGQQDAGGNRKRLREKVSLGQNQKREKRMKVVELIDITDDSDIVATVSRESCHEGRNTPALNDIEGTESDELQRNQVSDKKMAEDKDDEC